MRTNIMLIVLFIFFTVSATNAQDRTHQNEQEEVTDSTVSAIESVGSDTLIYKVYGMDCPGCQGALEKQINKLDVVSSSKADWLKQEVKIVTVRDSVLNEKELFEMIEKANFTPGEHVIK